MGAIIAVYAKLLRTKVTRDDPHAVDDSNPPKKCDGVESECKCVDHDGNIDRRVDFYTHGFVFENEAGEVCLPAGA